MARATPGVTARIYYIITFKKWYIGFTGLKDQDLINAV